MASGMYTQTHTHTRTHTFADESDYKTSGARWPMRVPGLKYIATHVHVYEDFSKVRIECGYVHIILICR